MFFFNTNFFFFLKRKLETWIMTYLDLLRKKYFSKKRNFHLNTFYYKDDG